MLMGHSPKKYAATCQVCGAPFESYKYGGRLNKTCGARKCIRAMQGASHRQRMLELLEARNGMCKKGLHKMTDENRMEREHGIRCRGCHNEAAKLRNQRKAEANRKYRAEVERIAAMPRYAPLYVGSRLAREQIDDIVARYEPGSSGPNGTVALAAEYGISRTDLWEYLRVRKAEGEPKPERAKYRNRTLGAVMA